MFVLLFDFTFMKNISYNDYRVKFIKRGVKMYPEIYQEIFNRKIGEIMELLEVSENEPLKKAVKKKMWDLSDELKEEKLIKEVKDGTHTRE